MSLLSPPLEAFMAIVKQQTVHGAASVLHVTQTAVTQRIRSLEQRLKTTLFTRTRRGMALTPEGEALYHYCQAALELEGEALAKMLGAGVEVPVQVAIFGPSSFMHARVIPQCSHVLKQFPKLLMQFDIHDAGDPIKALRHGDCQFAIIPEEAISKELTTKTLVPEKNVLLAPASWAKRDLKEIIRTERIIDYNPTDTMTFNYLKHFDLYQEASHERHFANRPESIAVMIAERLGYGVLTRELSQPYVASGRLVELNAGRDYEYQQVLAWYERHEPPAYFQAIVDAID